MPTRITYDNGNMIDYLYSASGVKLEVTHTTNKLLMVNSNIGNSAAAKASLKTTDLLTIDEPALAGRTSVQAPAASNLDVQTTDYINGYILENGTLSQIQMNGGYMTEDSQGKAVYHFYLQDHQGNTRVVVNGKTLAVEQVNHYYPYGGLFAESTGGEVQAFKYNGKELDRMCGLNWYDHGARHNDAAIGRWHCIDPQAASFYDTNPYCYCLNNPVNCVDEDGEMPTIVIGAIAGALISGSIALYEGKSGREVMAAAAGGAVSGALAGAGVGIVGAVVSKTAPLAIQVAANAVGGSVFNGVGNFAGNEVEQGLSIGIENIDHQKAIENGVTGVVVGLVTGGMGRYAENVVRGSLGNGNATAIATELKEMQDAGISLGSSTGKKILSNNEIIKKANSIVEKSNEAKNQFTNDIMPKLGLMDPVNQLTIKYVNENK